MSKSKSSDQGRPRGLTDRIVWRAIGELREFPGNPRRHPDRQLAGLMKSIDRVWTNPILIDEDGTILAGHLRREAAKRLGMTEVPTLTISGLSAAEKRAVVIADNRLPEQAVWDFDLLRGHFKNLIELDFDVELTGFSTGEVDLLIDGSTESPTTDRNKGCLREVYRTSPNIGGRLSSGARQRFHKNIFNNLFGEPLREHRHISQTFVTFRTYHSRKALHWFVRIDAR